MNKKLTGLAIFLMCSLLFVPAAMAATSPCPTSGINANLSYYETNFSTEANGCTIGTLTFWNFNYTDSQGTGGASDPGPAANQVAVTSVNEGVYGNGLSFTGNWNAGNTSNVDITFDVVNSSPQISDVYIGLGGFGGATGPGNINYTESFCSLMGTNCSEYVDYPQTNTTTDITLNSTTLAGTTSGLQVDKDVSFTPNCGTCTLPSVSNIINAYSTVPEPRAISLVLAMGLIALLVIKRRRAAQN